MTFAADAGYWPWAAIVLAVTAVLLFGLRKYYDTKYYDTQEQRS